MSFEDPFSECIKVLQKSCTHNEIEVTSSGTVLCMCCGKVLEVGEIEESA